MLITLEYQLLKSSLVVCLLVKAGKSLLDGGFFGVMLENMRDEAFLIIHERLLMVEKGCDHGVLMSRWMWGWHLWGGGSGAGDGR